MDIWPLQKIRRVAVVESKHLRHLFHFRIELITHIRYNIHVGDRVVEIVEQSTTVLVGNVLSFAAQKRLAVIGIKQREANESKIPPVAEECLVMTIRKIEIGHGLHRNNGH